MKQKLPVIVELERIVTVLNRGVFGDKIQIPPFVVQHDKKFAFRFIPDFYHVVVGAGFTDLPIMHVAGELLHELVHIRNWARGHVDCTSNQYHNKFFLRTALDAGFYVGRDLTRKGEQIVSIKGWCITQFHSLRDTTGLLRVMEPGKEAVRRRNACLRNLQIDRQCLLQGKRAIRQMIQERLPQRICFLKYVCKCSPPHNSIRSGRRPDGPHPLKVRCETCGSLFKCLESKEEAGVFHGRAEAPRSIAR